jgi:tRNA 5-methylaminomethyl-2-thiouridine biosynthesis bifunctional protein
MTLAWQHALQHYPKFQAFRPIQVHQLALKKAEDLLDLEQQYPAGLLTTETTADCALITEYPSLNLTEAGAVSPHQLKDQILAHPLIQFVQANITQIHPEHNELFNAQAQSLGQFDHVIVCCARHTAAFFEQYPVLKPIRGQVSWVENTAQPLALNQAYSYGGYCMQLDAQQFILGASFYPNRDDSDVLLEDHVHNYELIHSVFPDYAQSLPDVRTWQGRASVRAQSLDYFPVLGKMSEQTEIYSFAGLGSKGFLFAPLCSEILAAQILKEACPVPESLLQKLSPTRFHKKLKAKKPYFKAQS